jgi:5-(carboxyamino)imidazole ribonucleotide synthase
MATIGILGGGQLARMLALAGAPLGARFRVMDQAADACAGQVAPLVVADYKDRAALAAFARDVDVVTFDFENVPAESAQFLAERVPVFPNPRALAVAQDRLEEKNLFRALGADTPEFRAVESEVELTAAVQALGFPCVLKTRRLGYDGKGQFRLAAADDIARAWAALGGVPLILEAWVPFEREVSVVAVRGRDGELRCWPLTQNWHRAGILAASYAPAPEVKAFEPAVCAFAARLAAELDYVGVFAIELFVAGGRVLVNEMAPRVHNSGHWTIEGAQVSQFENHVRAVLGLPLGSPALREYSVMLNWIGELPDRAPLLREPGAHWHDYGKDARAGRKVGHATLCAADPSVLNGALQRIGRALGRDAQVAPVVELLR